MRAAFVAGLICASVSTISQSDGLTLDQLATIRTVTEASVSPNGEHVAYVVRIPRDPFEDKDGAAYAELMVLTGDGGPRRYVHGAGVVKAIEWSPDSKGIFFLSKREGDEHWSLRAIPVDGGESFEVCALDKRDVSSFTLAADGRSVAMVAVLPDIDDREKLDEHGFKANVVEESARASQIYLADVDIETDCNPELIELPGSVIAADFSGQSDRLLVKLAPTPHIDDEYMHTRLRVVNLEGAVETEINNLGKLGGARFSPDGRQIAFIGVADHNDPREGRLKIASVSDGEIISIDPVPDGHVIDMVWADNDIVLALAHIGVESEIRAINTRLGNEEVRIGQGGQVLRSLSLSSDGARVIAVADSPSHPGEVFDLSAQPERLTDSNPWLADIMLGRQEAVRYRAADGLALEGVVIYPLGFDPGTRYPMISFVHGGPESHRSNGWLSNYSQPIQVAAANGYVSFVPNYRGSTGRGVAFSKMDQHAYATPEFDDIVDGKNHLVELGIVDKDRVGITGGSYGGYATAWSATALSEHYAAGVMFVGISNQISKFGTTDIPNEMFQVHSRAWPWDDWNWMLERSPIYHVQKSRTPLLILHGDADPRVHPSQSLEMYRYLKQAGNAPVRLVLYPGEKHGNRKAAAQLDYSIRFMRWMDHYLKGDGGEPPDYEIDFGSQFEEE